MRGHEENAMSDIAEQSEDTPKVGRPLMFQSVEELDQKINEYFESRAPQRRQSDG